MPSGDALYLNDVLRSGMLMDFPLDERVSIYRLNSNDDDWGEPTGEYTYVDQEECRIIAAGDSYFPDPGQVIQSKKIIILQPGTAAESKDKIVRGTGEEYFLGNKYDFPGTVHFELELSI